MTAHLELIYANNIKRDDNDVPYAWNIGHLIKEFDNPTEFLDYVRDNVSQLGHAVAFSPSASLIRSANIYLTEELKKAGVL